MLYTFIQLHLKLLFTVFKSYCFQKVTVFDKSYCFEEKSYCLLKIVTHGSAKSYSFDEKVTDFVRKVTVFELN